MISALPNLWCPIAVLLLLVLLKPGLAQPVKARRELITSNHGAVAAADGRCSRIKRDVFCEGGHTMDVAVAAALCLGVISTASSGIGGGAFMLLRLADGKAQALDMTETVPPRASQSNPNNDLRDRPFVFYKELECMFGRSVAKGAHALGLSQVDLRVDIYLVVSDDSIENTKKLMRLRVSMGEDLGSALVERGKSTTIDVNEN